MSSRFYGLIVLQIIHLQTPCWDVQSPNFAACGCFNFFKAGHSSSPPFFFHFLKTRCCSTPVTVAPCFFLRRVVFLTFVLWLRGNTFLLVGDYSPHVADDALFENFDRSPIVPFCFCGLNILHLLYSWFWMQCFAGYLFYQRILRSECFIFCERLLNRIPDILIGFHCGGDNDHLFLAWKIPCVPLPNPALVAFSGCDFLMAALILYLFLALSVCIQIPLYSQH